VETPWLARETKYEWKKGGKRRVIAQQRGRGGKPASQQICRNENGARAKEKQSGPKEKKEEMLA